jgi:prepilin-type N-terminal cleavage/methylation domain-containing protein
MRKRLKNQRGDTLIEVLIAVAVLSLATVMTMTVVNNSHREILAEINRETVRSQVNSQAELLQYFHDMAEQLGAAGADANWLSGKPIEVEFWDYIRALALENPEGSTLTEAADTCGPGIVEGTTRGSAFYITRVKPKDGASDSLILREDSEDFKENFIHTNTGSDYRIIIKDASKRLRHESRWSASPGQGIWINAIHKTANTNSPTADEPNNYYDFYIKACWLSANSTEDRFSLLIRLNNSLTTTVPSI